MKIHPILTTWELAPSAIHEYSIVMTQGYLDRVPPEDLQAAYVYGNYETGNAYVTKLRMVLKVISGRKNGKWSINTLRAKILFNYQDDELTIVATVISGDIDVLLRILKQYTQLLTNALTLSTIDEFSITMRYSGLTRSNQGD